MDLAQAGKVATIKANGVEYTNNTNIPDEFAELIAHTQQFNPEPTIDFLSITDLLLPIRKLIYAIQFGINKSIVDLSTVSEKSKQIQLQTGIQSTLSTIDGYIINEHRVVSGLATNLPIITPQGELKLVRQYTSSIIAKLADERTAISSIKPTLAEMELKYPLHFEYVFELSAGRYLAPDIVTADRGYVLMHITDSNAYGKLPEYSDKSYLLYSVEEVKKYIDTKLAVVKQHLADGTLPLCTALQKGHTPPEYKIKRLSKSGKFTTVRGTKSHNIKDAQHFLLSSKAKPGDHLHTTPAVNTNCLVCQYRAICDQKDK